MISGLSKNEQLVLEKFKKTIEKVIGKNLVELRLYGSKARGEARKNSDVDVLVITSISDWHICDVIYDIATDILLDYDICISPKVINERDYDHLKKMNTPFIKNLFRNGVTI